MVREDTGVGLDSSRLPLDSLEWWTPGRFAIVLGVLIFLWYPEVILGRATFYFRDFGLFGYPLAHYHRECFWRGEVPLWNPFNYCGLPFLAQWNTMTLYPPSLFYLLFPLSWALGVFCLAHMFWAGMGMYFLIRQWNRCLFAAAIAGVGFACNGLMWNSLMWPNNIAGLSWMPWILLVTDRAWKEGGRSILVAALVGGIQMMTGAPEIILLTWVIVTILWFCGATQRDPGWRVHFLRHVGRISGVIFLVLGLASAQLLPFLDLLSSSQRDADYGGTAWAMPGTGWANFLVPLFGTMQSLQGVHFQPEQYWTASYYMGIGILALALVSVWNFRRREQLVLVILTLAGMILALGNDGHFLPFINELFPKLGFMRFPIKFVVLPVFLLPLMAGLALGHLLEPTHSDLETRLRFRPILMVSAMLAVFVLILVWFAHEFPTAVDQSFGALAKNALVRMMFLVGMIVLLSHRLSRVPSRTFLIMEICLVALLWLDIRLHAPNLNPTVPRSVYDPNLARDYINGGGDLGLGQGRAVMDARSLAQINFRMPSVPADDYLGRRLALYSNVNLLDQIPKINGFYSLYPREMHKIVWSLSMKTNAASPALLDFMNVAYENVPGTLMDWRLRPSWMPLITIGQKPVFMDSELTLTKLFDRSTDFRKEVYLPKEAMEGITADGVRGGKVLSIRMDRSAIEIEAEAGSPSMIVLAQSYYHCWRATVNGIETHLWRANYGFQALEIPKGRSTVRLVYRDRGFLAGSGISFLCFAGCLVGLRMNRKTRFIRRDGSWYRIFL